MPEFRGVRVDETYAEEMEREVNSVLDALFEGLDAEDINDMPDAPSSAPFCGCSDCVVREVMVMTTEMVAKGFRQGVIEHTGNEL